MAVTFNTLKLSRDSSTLFISVDSTHPIEKIVIDDQYTYSSDPTIPSKSPVYEYIPSEENTSISLEVHKDSLKKPWGNRLLFVYVITSEEVVVKYVFNWFNIYHTGIKYTDRFFKSRCCSIPMDFIDFILRTKAFEFNLEAGNFLNAIKLWKIYFEDNSELTEQSCCCNL